MIPSITVQMFIVVRYNYVILILTCVHAVNGSLHLPFVSRVYKFIQTSYIVNILD